MYESFSVFCPDERIESLDLLATEDVLIDWTQPIYLNFTQCTIVERIEKFPINIVVTEKIAGDIYVQSEPPPEELQLDELVCHCNFITYPMNGGINRKLWPLF